MRVFHVFGAMDVGGAELRTLDLQRSLQPHGVEFQYLTLSGREGELAEEIRQLGGEIYPLELDLRFPWLYYRLLRTYQPDAVDSHVATFSGLLLAIAWLARVPIRIAHFRSDGDGHGPSLRRRAQRLVMSTLIRLCATDIVGVSPSALSAGYRSDWTSDSRARVLVNGFSPYLPDEDRRPLRDELGINPEILLVHVGRPSPEKNRILTVHILAELRNTGRNASLALAGGFGLDSDSIREAAEQLGVEAWVFDLGQRRDARDLLADADVAILTSVREGLPGVVLEALSTGTPMVATDLPGVLYIASGVNGVYPVSLEQHPRVWASAIIQAFENSRIFGTLEGIKNSFETSEFALDRATCRHRELYGGFRVD